MDSEKLRAWWFHRQGLGPDTGIKTSRDVLDVSGWCRSVGGSNCYLTLFSRARISRAQADSDAAAGHIRELPSARGCTYFLPFGDFELGLAVGRGFGDAARAAEANRYFDFDDAQLATLCEQILAALRQGAMDPRQLKAALGDKVRNFGAAGKARGMTTALPLGLGALQAEGRIRRVPTDGRLDQQRYSYELWDPSPAESSKLTRDEAFRALAEKYFRWIGPASSANFQWFSGLGLSAAKEVLSNLELVPVADGSDLLIQRDDKAEFDAFTPPAKPQYALLSALDSLFLHRRDLSQLLAREDIGRQVMGEGGLRRLGALADLPSNAIVDRGRIVGLWEYDPGARSIAWLSFIDANGALRAAVEETETFIREELGDARSFSLDGPASRAERIASLRS